VKDFGRYTFAAVAVICAAYVMLNGSTDAYGWFILLALVAVIA